MRGTEGSYYCLFLNEGEILLTEKLINGGKKHIQN